MTKLGREVIGVFVVLAASLFVAGVITIMKIHGVPAPYGLLFVVLVVICATGLESFLYRRRQ